MGTLEKIKVCHLASGDLWAGAEVQIADLLCELIRFEELELSAILYNSGTLADCLCAAHIPVDVFEESQHNSLKLIRLTKQSLRRSNPDILHVHRYKETVLGARAAKAAGVRNVIRTVHGMPEPQSGIKKMKARFYQFLNDWTVRKHVDMLIAVSHDIERQLRHVFPRTAISTIHNGINLQRLQSTADPIKSRRALGIPDGHAVIGTVGRLTPVKAYHDLLAAHQHLLTQYPDVTLIIAGDGPELPRLQQLAKDLGIAEKVIFPGFVREVPDLLRLLDIFVLSSLHEGISIALLEACALGVPAVVTNVGGNPEVVHDGENGLLVPARNPVALAEACGNILQDNKLREQMRKNGPTVIARQFSHQAMAQRVQEEYQRLMEQT